MLAKIPPSALAPATLLGFLFVLARIGGIFVFAPIPSMKEGPETIRVVLSLAITVALFPFWPKPSGLENDLGGLVVALISEAAIGITIGMGVAFITELLQLAAQIGGMQAGYGFASTIDPSSQADSGILLVAAQLFAGLLFFSTGLDREVVRVCALSLQAFPPGSFHISTSLAEAVVRAGAGMFSLGLRLALPLVALLGMVDLSLALLGRINAQLQLLTLAFPVKMLAALALLAFTAVVFERIFVSYSAVVFATIRQFVTHGG